MEAFRLPSVLTSCQAEPLYWDKDWAFVFSLCSDFVLKVPWDDLQLTYIIEGRKKEKQ